QRNPLFCLVNAGIAQLVEQLICNQQVVGSNPSAGFFLLMLQGNRIVVVMPAYNAARTLRQTYDEVIGHNIVDEIILVDDASGDETAAIARTLDRVRVEVHPENRGYGG